MRRSRGVGRRVRALLVAAPVLVAHAAAQEAVATAEARVEVRLEAYYETLSARDWERLPDHFWPRSTVATVWVPPGEEEAEVLTQTVEEFAARGPEGPGSREIFEERPLSVEVEIREGLAQAWVRYRARFGDPENVREWEGTDAFTLLRHDGRWRISSLAFAPGGEG